MSHDNEHFASVSALIDNSKTNSILLFFFLFRLAIRLNHKQLQMQLSFSCTMIFIQRFHASTTRDRIVFLCFHMKQQIVWHQTGIWTLNYLASQRHEKCLVWAQKYSPSRMRRRKEKILSRESSSLIFAHVDVINFLSSAKHIYENVSCNINTCTHISKCNQCLV